MYKVLSQSNTGRGLTFYRVLALAAASGNFIFGLFFLSVYTNGRELIIDRAVFMVAHLWMYWQGSKKNADIRSYAGKMHVLIFLNSLQVVWTIVYNNFDGFYLLTLLVTVQVFSYAFRSQRNTFWYLLYICVVILGSLWIMTEIDRTQKWIYSGLIIMMAMITYHSARVKCHFMNQMKMNQDLLRSLFSRSENAIFLTDMNGSILDVNIRASELFGYAREEFIEHDFKMVRKNALTNEELELGLEQLETSRYWTTESVLLRKDGNQFPARLTLNMISNETTQLLVYRVLDITRQKETESRLIESKEKAEEAVLAKSQFLAVMSHEIRTPLNGVIATASLLQRTDLNAEQEEYANTISQSGQNLLMLINDILEFSKMENGKMILDCKPEKILDGVFDVTDLLRPHAESKNVQLNVNIASAVHGYAEVDLHRLKQVMFNLVGNAIKFTDKGKVTISVECDRLNATNGIYHFGISDTGIGIPEDKLYLLFKSFSQVDSSISRRYGGTGLGLAISKQIIELMGGSIDVKSTVGEGTTFTFHIPCKLLNEQEVLASAEGNIALPGDFSGVKVLVAEDNEINTQVLKFILESLKVEHTFVNDGSRAYELCSSNMYDVVFMDLNMPVMDGLTATMKIRQDHAHQPVIIAITANNFEDDIQKCRHAGMNDFLGKPFNVDQLKQMFHRWFPEKGKNVVSAA